MSLVSPPHRRHIAAHIYYASDLVAEVYWERGEFFCELYGQQGANMWTNVPAITFAQQLQRAVDQLRERLDAR